jgi:hypothetical protein
MSHPRFADVFKHLIMSYGAAGRSCEPVAACEAAMGLNNRESESGSLTLRRATHGYWTQDPFEE